MYHLELNKTLVNTHTHTHTHTHKTTQTMTILNKVQYFQNKCGCNKTLVYLLKKKKKKQPPNLWQYYKQSTKVPK